MIGRYRGALLCAVIAVALMATGFFTTGPLGGLALVGAAALGPATVLLAVLRRTRQPLPVRALVTGGVVGPLFALLSHGAVLGFAATFLLGFADSGRRLVESLGADPRLVTAFASPWVLVALVDLVAVAPFTEEIGKALGAAVWRPSGRTEAFVFGIAAGVGFAIVENVLYAFAAVAEGGPWVPTAVARTMGAAVHPLSTGLLMLGWWEWKNQGRTVLLLRGYLAAVLVHALWNGTIVVVTVVEGAYQGASAAAAYDVIALVSSAVLGVVLLAGLWFVAGSVAEGRKPLEAVTFTRAQPVVAFTLLASSLLVPVAVLVLAFPAFYRG